MSNHRRRGRSDTLLELWRPPQGAGDPVGCLATTFTFAPGLFDEQCLARFLEIESEPNREGLAFLLERERQLGSVYAGVLVDHRHAGVEHSLRWDVLPVRIWGAKQHAKMSLLAWSRHMRIVVTSGNLTEPGYRSNYEVAVALDFGPNQTDRGLLGDAVEFLRRLVEWVPGAQEPLPEVLRARAFLTQVLQQSEGWRPAKRSRTVRQSLVCTLPPGGAGRSERSSLSEALSHCRGRGGAPREAWVASPFFDDPAGAAAVSASLCKSMARGSSRSLRLCVPGSREGERPSPPRLSAPDALLKTPGRYGTAVTVEMLPEVDPDKNRRPWHAKMLALRGGTYSALMVGSSNFTCAGMGIGSRWNAEANLLTVIDWEKWSREIGQLEAVWPETERLDDPSSAEWLGSVDEPEEGGQDAVLPVPGGFLAATYRAGDERRIILLFDPDQLPEEWSLHACGQNQQMLFSSTDWRRAGSPRQAETPWTPPQPPEKLMVSWDGNEAFLPLNVEDSRALPPPAVVEQMSSDDMLWILAAADPSAAFQAWAGKRESSDFFDPDLDSATPPDLDPLRRYSLEATFLHRIRRRARVLAQLRRNLERPVWGPQALDWRLRGFIGINALAHRLANKLGGQGNDTDEALLELADFMIVLREVNYTPTKGALSKEDFDRVFREFLKELAQEMSRAVQSHRNHLSGDVLKFWKRVNHRCHT